MKYFECVGCRFLKNGDVCHFCFEAEHYEAEDCEPLDFDDVDFKYDPTLDPYRGDDE